MAKTGSRVGHQDIRIGTLVNFSDGADYIQQILPHGFESFQYSAWRFLGDVDLTETAKKTKDIIGDTAVISSLAIFGNPLQDEQTATDWARLIRAARSFGCDIVAGFAGALEDRPVPESMEKFKEIWTPLVRLAEDEGVRIAFENCDMGGNWERPHFNIAHAPTMWERIFDALPSPNLGLEWEPCHQMSSLIDPLPQLRKWLPKIFHLHGKDATIHWDILHESGLRGGVPFIHHRSPGFGDTNWTDVLSILRMGGFRGSIDIEGWHDPVYCDDLEMTGQVYALNYLKQCRGGSFVANPST